MKRLEALKDIHKGKRAFLIGLGPSLKVSDLEMLKDEITFSCNKVYLSFDKTDWRPTYYSITDLFVAENTHNIVSSLPLKKIFSDNILDYFPPNQGLNSGITWVKHHKKIRNNDGELIFNFSKDLCSGTYRGGSVIYFQMQLAFYMGIKEMYLLGVDFSYKNSEESNEDSMHGKVLISGSNEGNHFHPNYRKKNEKWSKPDMERQLKAYLYAKEFLYKRGVSVQNLTPNSKLSVFDRNTLVQVLKN